MHSDPLQNQHALEIIQSKDNPLLKKIRGIANDARSYKDTHQIWLEGEHLCAAAFDKGVLVEHLICSHSYHIELNQTHPLWLKKASRVSVIHDNLFKLISSLPSPANVGFLVPSPNLKEVNPLLQSVILDRVQDAGNVGSILRSAAAFGYKQIIALKGTAGLWSAKVLRAGMGAHFNMHLIESATLEDVRSLQIPLLCTSSHEGSYLHELQLSGKIPAPCAWIFGHEGQGVRDELLAIAAHRVKIPQPYGEESLNVAAATAICLYAGISQGTSVQTDS